MVLYHHTLASQDYAWMVKREGTGWSTPMQVTNETSGGARWSPTEDAFGYVANGTELRIQDLKGTVKTIARVPAPERLNGFTWSLDGRALYFKKFDGAGVGSFWMVPASGGRPRLLVTAESVAQSPTPYPIATDGRNLFFTTSTSRTDIWLAELKSR